MADEFGFWKYAQAHPDSLAIVEPDGSEHTYGELFEEVNRVSHGLRARGVETEDAVAMVMRNGEPLYEVYLAAMQCGWYLVPINYHSTANEIAFLLEDSGAKAVVCTPEFADATAEAADRAGVPSDMRFASGPADGFRTLADLKDDQPVTLPDDRVGGQVMQYTSGTTGRPKAVRRRITGVDADEATKSLKWVFDTFGMVPGENNVWLVTSPLYHTANISLSSIAIHFGMAVVVMDKWTPEGMLERIERYRVTTTHMVPTQFVRLLELPKETRDRYDISSLTYVIHGAAPCPTHVKQRMFDWWGPVIYEYYGSTEVGATLVRPYEWLERPGTVGRPFPVSTLKILDDDGNELPPGEVGKVYMRQGNDRVEYKDDPDKTTRARQGDLMTVGDLGYVDEDGFLFLVGRDAEVIISGGVNIYPAEAESALLGHDAVADVAVIGVPDDEFGEAVKAVVQPADGHGPSQDLEAELIAYCREEIAHFKCPRSVDFVEELPRDPNGKLYKHKLREPYWAGRERAI